MSEQELNNNPDCDAQDETGVKKETNTAMIVWLVVSIVSFLLSLVCFVMGLIGIFVSLGLLMLPLVGVFGIGFTVLFFVAGGVFLLLGIGALVGVFCSRKKSENNEISG